MENRTLQQEVLMVIATTFTKRQWFEKKTSAKLFAPSEQLEEACWNGLLDELLPEIMLSGTSGKRLYLWNIKKGASCLQIELSEFPLYMEKSCSINPVFFLAAIKFN